MSENDVFEKWECSLALARDGQTNEACEVLKEMARLCESRAKGSQEKFYLDWQSRALRESARFCQFALHQPERALGLFLRAKDVSRKTGDAVVESACLNNAGDCLRELGREMDALDAYCASYSLLERLPYGKGHAISLWNISDTYRRLSKVNDAIKYATIGLELVRRSGDSGRIADFELILRQLGQSECGNQNGIVEKELPPNANKILSLERQFQEYYGTIANVFVGRARAASHFAQMGLTKKDLQRVSLVPLTSFPMNCINACVCRLPPDSYYINIGPELLMAFWETCNLVGDSLKDKSKLTQFEEILCAFVLRLAQGRNAFDRAKKMEEHFFGMMLWQIGTAWVVLHEYGHFLLGHLSDRVVSKSVELGCMEETLEICQTNLLDMEKEADEFATKTCLEVFSSLGGDEACWIPFAAGALMTILGSTRAVAMGIRGEKCEESPSKSHPSVFERVDSVTDIVGKRFPGKRLEVAQAVAPWRALCCSSDSLKRWWKFGASLKEECASVDISHLGGSSYAI